VLISCQLEYKAALVVGRGLVSGCVNFESVLQQEMNWEEVKVMIPEPQ